MINFIRKPAYGFADLVELVRILRDPDGCPWDSVQTHESIRRNFIEEVYEACDAIDRGDVDNLREELGDVLLHVVFHAGIEADAGRFTIDDVCDTVVRKMIGRHPALFGGDTSLDWDALKRREKGLMSLSDELSSVPRSLPALWRAEKMLKKAEAASFPVPATLPDQEMLEDPIVPAEMIGDLLLAAVALARSAGVDPEQALHQRCDALLTQARSMEQGQEPEKTAEFSAEQ